MRFLTNNHDTTVHIHKAEKLLPAWFIPRMMDDVWSFGLLLTSGYVIAIETILNVHRAADGCIWLDAVWMEHKHAQSVRQIFNLPFEVHGAPTSRTTISVNCAHVVMAFELADT